MVGGGWRRKEEGVVALQLDERRGAAVNGVSRAVDRRHAGRPFNCWMRGWGMSVTRVQQT